MIYSSKKMTCELRWVMFALLILIAITIMTYVPYLHEIGLYQDDWRNLGDFVWHGQINKTSRPINLAVLAFGWNLFGLNIREYLIAAVLLQFFSASMFWWLLYVLMPFSYKGLALPIAVLFLVYPSYYTRLWLTLWPHSLLVIVVLSGILSYVLFLRSWQAIWWFISIFLLGMSLFWYELQLALIAGLPILGLRQLSRSSWLRRFLILSPSFVAILYLVWWLSAPASNVEYGPQNFVFEQNGLANVVSMCIEMVRRLARSYWTVMLVAWIEPLRFLSPQPLQRWQAIVAFVAIACAAVLTSFLLVRQLPSISNTDRHGTATTAHNNSWLLGVTIALAGIGLGVLPNLPQAEVAVAIFLSRFTLFATLGAAALIVFSLYGVGRLLFQNHQRIVFFVYGVSTVLTVIAILYQMGAQRAMIAGWERQKCAWYSMLAQAPAFEDGTHVHILDVPVGSGIWEVAPFEILVSEVDSSLKLIYSNPSLSGSFAHVGNVIPVYGAELQLTPVGLQDETTGSVIPYDQAVIFRYHGDDSLELLKEIPSDMTGGNSAQPTGIDRILSETVVSPYQRLIEPRPRCAYSS